jgi:hypothetical protein
MSPSCCASPDSLLTLLAADVENAADYREKLNSDLHLPSVTNADVCCMLIAAKIVHPINGEMYNRMSLS